MVAQPPSLQWNKLHPQSHLCTPAGSPHRWPTAGHLSPFHSNTTSVLSQARRLHSLDSLVRCGHMTKFWPVSCNRSLWHFCQGSLNARAPFCHLEWGFYSWHSSSCLGQRGGQPVDRSPMLIEAQWEDLSPGPDHAHESRLPILVCLPQALLREADVTTHLVQSCPQNLAAWLTATEQNTGRGKSRSTVASTWNPEFILALLLMIALFSTRTTARVRLPHPVLTECLPHSPSPYVCSGQEI